MLHRLIYETLDFMDESEGGDMNGLWRDGFFRGVCLATLLWPFPAIHAEDLRGPAFTPQDQVQEMPEAWKTRGVVYDRLPADTDIAITLDQHLYPALLPLIQDYANEKHLKIAVEEGTCGISAGALQDKTVDMGGYCCPPGQQDRLPGLEFHTLGIASLALLVHPSNSLENISLQQARDIYQGKLGDWNQVDPQPGNQKRPIHSLARLHCKKRPGHWRLLLDNEDLFSPTTHEVSTIQDMITQTGANRNAIGYEMLWMKQKYQDAGLTRALSIDGVSPEDSEALVAGRYPLYRSYNIATWADPQLKNPHMDELLDYLYQHFESIEPKYGFVSARRLREAGWVFSGNELIGEPR